MAEYIDKGLLKENVLKTYMTVWEESTKEYGKQIVVAIQDLEYLPVSDVAPVKHGKWNCQEDIYGDSTYICSYCGEPWILLTGAPESNNMNYCPCCGAKMDL